MRGRIVRLLVLLTALRLKLTRKVDRRHEQAHTGSRSRRDGLAVAIVGAGRAGLALGYYLNQYGLEFVILEGAPRWATRGEAGWTHYACSRPGASAPSPISSSRVSPMVSQTRRRSRTIWPAMWPHLPSRWRFTTQERTFTFSDGAELEVSNVVWATGFRGDYRWVNVPVFDADGRPLHKRGVTESPGLYFLGLRGSTPWAQGLTGFVKHDARFLAEVIASREEEARS
jgi:hypothetical protein